MKQNKMKKTGKGRILCWLLALALVLTSVQVPAAVFEAPENPEDIFCSGPSEQGYVQEPEGGNTVGSGTDTDNGAEPQATPAPDNSADAQITPIPDNSADVQVTPVPGGSADAGAQAEDQAVPGREGDAWNPEAEGDIMLFRETDLADPPLIHNGDPVTVKFMDSTGKYYYDALETAAVMGTTIPIPEVPGYEGAEGSGWKLDLETPDEEAILIEGGETLSLSLEEDLDEYIVDGVLVLYAVSGKEMCTVTFYNNSGTGIFNGGKMKVAKGSTIVLPDFPSSKYVNFGWTTSKSGKTVQYALGGQYTVNRNVNFYIVRYAAAKVMSVTFLNPNGSTNAALKNLNTRVVKNSTLKLPSLPSVTGYANLGWSTKKNASSATYLAGRSVKITKNLVLYAVRKKLPTYSVTFNNNSGTSTSKAYSALGQKVAKNNYIILPELPKASGYQNIGWTTTRKGSKPLYKAGAKVKVTKNMKFYTVRQKSKYYTVTFCLGNGSTNTAYKILRKKAEEDTMITLPGVPDRKGYLNLGWSTKKNATLASNREGTKYNVTKNTVFYAVQYQAMSVVLHYNNGTVYRTVSVGKGTSFKLPSVSSKQPYTFMGWSKSPYQRTNPNYEAGETVTVNGEIHLYATVFDRSVEEDITEINLSQPDLRKYKQVIFVGDSRTNRMDRTLKAQFSSSLLNGVTFIDQEGGGLPWLKSAGYESLKSAVGNGTGSILEKPTAVIFNLGVNDLYSSAAYVVYMNGLAAELKSKGCRLYYMSVNPVNSKMVEASGHGNTRTEAGVRQFNSVMKSGLAGNYTYIDTYSWLVRTGYGTDAGTRGADVGVDDGLHYTTKTYKRIYNYCMKEYINK